MSNRAYSTPDHAEVSQHIPCSACWGTSAGSAPTHGKCASVQCVLCLTKCCWVLCPPTALPTPQIRGSSTGKGRWGPGRATLRSAPRHGEASAGPSLSAPFSVSPGFCRHASACKDLWWGICEFKQCLLAVNTQLGVCCAASRRVSQSGSPRHLGAEPAHGLGSALADKRVPVRRAPSLQITTATFVPAPWGWWRGRQHQALCVQIGALPARLRPAWLHVTKTPGRREVMSSLRPFLSPHIASSHWWSVCAFWSCTKFLSHDDVFPQAAYVFHTGRPFSLSFLNIWPSEELGMTS